MRYLLPLILLLGACDKAPPDSEAQPAETPTSLQFPVDADSTRFMYFDPAGKRVVTSDRDEIPTHVMPYVAVLLGERTSAPEGQVFQWDAREDERVGTARRVDEATLIGPSIAAWSGYDTAMLIWEMGTVHALEAETDGVTLEAPKKIAKAVPQAPKPKKVTVPKKKGIEIVGLNDSIPTGMEPAKTVGWKPVTIYYSDTCGRCRRAMSWMDQEGVRYSKKNIANESENRAMWAIARREGWGGSVSLPVVVIGSERKVMSGWNTRKFTRLAQR